MRFLSSTVVATAFLYALPAAAAAARCEGPTGGALSGPPAKLLSGALRQLATERPRLRPARAYALYFGAAWCGPCRLQVRKMKPLYEGGEPAALGYEIVFVSRDRDAKAAAAYAAAEAMPWPYLPPNAVREVSSLGARSLPDMVVVDEAGRILCRAYAPDGRYLGAVEMLEALRASLRSR